MKTGQERRTFPRVNDEKISLRLGVSSFNPTLSQSLNISASGVCCKVDKELPLLTRVQIKLSIPALKDASESQQMIETEGVVVREHPVIENGKTLHYDVAIFFDNLSENDRDRIKEYVSKKIS